GRRETDVCEQAVLPTEPVDGRADRGPQAGERGAYRAIERQRTRPDAPGGGAGVLRDGALVVHERHQVVERVDHRLDVLAYRGSVGRDGHRHRSARVLQVQGHTGDHVVDDVAAARERRGETVDGEARVERTLGHADTERGVVGDD